MGDLNDCIIELNMTANVGWNLDMKWQHFWATLFMVRQLLSTLHTMLRNI